jgi:hypothetical protein
MKKVLLSLQESSSLKLMRKLHLLVNWNITGNCFQTIYHPSFMVHWWVLVTCLWVVSREVVKKEK